MATFGRYLYLDDTGSSGGNLYYGERVGGAASSRSETPDRCLDFARLDSPAVGRYPLRERSPPNRLMGHHQQSPAAATLSGPGVTLHYGSSLHNTGRTPDSDAPLQNSNLHSLTTRDNMQMNVVNARGHDEKDNNGTRKTSGRPPLYNSNDENAIPYNQQNLAYGEAQIGRLPSRPSSARPPIRSSFNSIHKQTRIVIPLPSKKVIWRTSKWH